MTIKRVLTEGKVPVKIWTDNICDNSVQQLANIAKMPFIHKHVAAMPDVHLGKGATIGSVIPTLKAIIPAAVGVDIGCGMIAVPLSIRADQLPDDLGPMRSAIEAAVPHGRTGFGANDAGGWRGEATQGILRSYSNLVTPEFKEIEARHAKMFTKHTDGANQLGTLGGGNHFIEVCLDEANAVWVVLHSGSRGIGNRIGTYFIQQAKKEMEQWFITLPDKDLAYLTTGTQNFSDYVKMVHWAQNYASLNRRIMLNKTLDAIATTLGIYDVAVDMENSVINCHHNYISWENHFGKNVIVTRKGAIRARSGDLGIIPGSMGAKSFIIRGLGNAESFCSCSHGAGRNLSRTEAKKLFTVEDLKAQTAGIECPTDIDKVDEIPAAYKDIDEVMDNQSDLVEVVHTLRQVLNVKG